jgi:hypothetical protein
MVNGMPYIDHLDEVCESCVLNKNHRDSFAKKVNWKIKKPFELVHTNMIGLVKPMSTIHNRYFFTLFDDYSRKT